ncbi:class I SAM-dependent methyltransferase [Paenibacillus tarimensis]
MEHLKTNLTESYNNNSKLRDRSEIEEWKRLEMDKFTAYLQLAEQPRLLDLGAGPGHHSKIFHDQGLHVTCVDISPNMVQACRAKGLEAYTMDLYAMQFEDAIFGAIWSMNCLLHVPKSDLPSILQNIKRVLKPGGIFYMGVYGGYNHEGIWEDDPYTPQRFFSFFGHEDIVRVASEVFEIVQFDVVPLEGMKLDYQSLILR